jgi:hypothetical protein
VVCVRRRKCISEIEVEAINDFIATQCPVKSGSKEEILCQYMRNEELFSVYQQGVEKIYEYIYKKLLLTGVYAIHNNNTKSGDSATVMPMDIDTIQPSSSIPVYILDNVKAYIHNTKHTQIHKYMHMLCKSNNLFSTLTLNIRTHIANYIYPKRGYNARSYHLLMKIKNKLRIRRNKSAFSQQFDCMVYICIMYIALAYMFA